MPRFAAIGLIALSPWLAGCQGDPVQLCPLAADTPVFASSDLSGAPIGLLALGKPVSARRPGPLDDEDRWRVPRGDTVGWAAREALVVCPMQESDAFVIVPTTVRLDRPGGAGGQGLDRLAIGARVRVARGLPGVPDSLVTVLKDGLPIGFISASDLGLTPPDAPRLLLAAREALARSDLARARELAVAARAAENSETGPSASLLAALDNALAGAPITLPPAIYVPKKPVTEPGAAWIAAANAGTPLRPDSPSLPLGAAVRVLEIDGDKALIGLPEGVVAGRVLALGALEELRPDAISAALAEVSAAPGAPADAAAWGTVPLSALDGAAPNLALLLDETEPNRVPGALSAAFALAPQSAMQLEALRDRALRREADPLAVAAVARLTALRAGPAAVDELPITVSLTSLFGCNVEGVAESARRAAPGAPSLPAPPAPDIPSRAPEQGEQTDAGELEEADAPLLAALTEPTCLTDVPIFPECGEANPVAEWMDDSPPPDANAEAARMAAEQRRYDAEVAAWTRYHARHGLWLHALDTELTQPRIRVQLDNVSNLTTAPARLLLYGYRPERTGYCGMIGTASRADLALHWVDLPPLGPRQTLVLWVPNADYGDDYGAFVTANAEEGTRFEQLLRADWEPSLGGEPFDLADWALDQSASDGPGGDPCPVQVCGC